MIYLLVVVGVIYRGITRPRDNRIPVDEKRAAHCLLAQYALLSRVSEKMNRPLKINPYDRAYIRGQRNGKQFSIELKLGSETWAATVSVRLKLGHPIVIQPEKYYSLDDLEIGAPNFDGCTHLTGNPA